MKKALVISAALLLVVISAACSAANDGNSGKTAYQTATYSSPPVTTYASQGEKYPSPTITVTSAPAVSGGDYSSSTTLPDDRMIVRTGNISMVVDDIGATLGDIAQMAQAYGGYVVSSNSWKDGEKTYGAISVRVPAESYDSAAKSVSDMAVEVTSQSTSSQDVTEEYVDLTAQLNNLQATEQQLLTIMAKAEKIEDILAVQAQLTGIQSQIEQIKGRMQYLEKTSATSLLNVNLAQAKLEVKFNASTTSAKTGDDIQFYPDVAGGFTPYSYEWDFGDGNTSTSASPTHSYAKPGEFSVSLKVTDDRGNSQTETRAAYITIAQGGWSIGGMAGGAWQGLLWLGRGLLTVIVWLGIFSPVIIVIGVVIWWLRRRKAAAG